MPPERYDQNCGGTIMSAVDTFRRKVNRIIETPKDATTMYGVHRLLPDAEEPITTGKRGRMHGASTVSTPAINETMRNAMLLYFRNCRGERRIAH